jgi:Domain of unknown function (DUF6438)
MKRSFLIAAIAVLVSLLAMSQSANTDMDHAGCIRSLSGYPPELAKAPVPKRPSTLKDVSLVYFESGCLGTCPSFRMTMRPTGVVFEGHGYVRAKGKRVAKISAMEFQHFVDAWFNARMYAMRDDYCGISCPGGTKTVFLDVQETSIVLTTPDFSKTVYECYFAVDDKPASPKPPDEYNNLRAELYAFGNKKGWLK